MRVQEIQKRERLNRPDVPADRVLLPGRDLRRADHVEDGVAALNSAELRLPLPAAERVVARVEGSRQELRGEAGVRRVQSIALPAQDRGLLDPVGIVGPERHEESHRCGVHLRRGRVRADGVGAVGVRDVEFAGPDRHGTGQGQGDDRLGVVRAHGQNPTSIEKKKLRLGGNGATSMFRTMAWFAKFDTSGSRPLYGVNRNRLRPLAESRAVRIPKWRGISGGRLYAKVTSR